MRRLNTRFRTSLEPLADKVTNFFFGNHSLSTARAAALEREIKYNYQNPADPPSNKPK